MSAFEVNIFRNPVSVKVESGYNGEIEISIPNDGSGEPNVILFQDWMNKTIGARAPRGVWDSGLYGATNATAYPLYYGIDGVSGIGSRNNKTELIYTVAVQNSAYYNVPINNVEYSITSGASATASAIVSALVSRINADINCPAVASGTTTLILTRKDPAIPFYVNARSGGTEIVYPNAGYSSASESAGPGINLISDNGLTGFIKYLPNSSRIFLAWQMGVPDGFYFSGAWQQHTNPPQSCLKMGWASDQGLDDLGRADVVGTSRNSPTGWAMIGNQVNVNMSNGGQLNFGKLNSFMSYFRTGANAFTDNGTAINHIAGLAGTTTVSSTSRPLFIRRTTFTITAVSDFTYTVTINGTVCSYISDSSATQLEICNGLVADINSKISGSVGHASNQSNILTFDPAEGVLPTITNSSNLAKFELLPYFTQVSTIWQGNDNQVNTLHVYPWFYIAEGDNCGNFVALGDSATASSVKDWKVIRHSSWTTTGGAGGGTIKVKPTTKQRAGKTHWHRFVNGLPVAVGAI